MFQILLGTVCYYGPTMFLNVFSFKLSFFNRCDVLMLKIIFLKKNIILMHFQTKNILKSNLYHTPKLSHEKKKQVGLKIDI